MLQYQVSTFFQLKFYIKVNLIIRALKQMISQKWFQNNVLKFPVQMAQVTMESEFSCDVRFIFLTLRLADLKNLSWLEPSIVIHIWSPNTNISKICWQDIWYHSPVTIIPDLHTSDRVFESQLSKYFFSFLLLLFTVVVLYFFTPTSTLMV